MRQVVVNSLVKSIVLNPAKFGIFIDWNNNKRKLIKINKKVIIYKENPSRLSIYFIHLFYESSIYLYITVNMGFQATIQI